MSNEIDLDQFIQVLDHALATDDPKIKKALKKFLFIAALAMEGDPEPGPFTAMLDEMDDLRRRVKALESSSTSTTYTDLKDYWYGDSSANATWKYINNSSTAGSNTGHVTITPNTSTTTTTINTGGCTGYIPSTSTTTYGGVYSGYTINLGDDEKGKRIKEELEQKLGMLNK
jgi:hypothetical protein